MSGNDGVTRTDALKTLNTEIMAGKGPDILILDGISSETYAEQGMLEDLSGILKEAGLLDNIESAYTKELISGIQDMISGEVSSLLLGALEDTEVAIGVHSDELLIGDLEIHPRSRKVLMKGSEISLTPKEFDILYFLAKNRGEVFTKEQIYRAVWEEDYLLDNSNIMAFIRKLRKKIEPAPDSPTYILTIWGIGYKFNDEL